MPIKGLGVSRIDGLGLLEFLERQVMLGELVMEMPEGYIRPSQTIVEMYGMVQVRAGFFNPFGIGIHLILEAVRFPERGKPQGKARVRIHRTIQRRNGLIEIARFVVALHVAERLQIRFISDGCGLASAGAQHLRGDPDVHELGDARDRSVLEGFQIPRAIFERCAADLPQIFCVD
jgi:hypothetical protein